MRLTIKTKRTTNYSQQIKHPTKHTNHPDST